VTGQWFSPSPPVSSIIKTDRHDITEILFKVALNTIKQANKQHMYTMNNFDFSYQV
jgi:5,10-methylenetetrahydrofolate reductase